jgi:hypothetical protein
MVLCNNKSYNFNVKWLNVGCFWYK